MLKNLFFIINVLTFITQTYAMEMDIEQQPSSQICWLLSLPQEILKIIGHFLCDNIIETKQDFINRTKYMTYGDTPFTYDREGKSTFSAYCPNHDKCAYLTISHIKNKFSPIIDNQQILFTILNEKNDLTLHQENISAQGYKTIGLSQDGNIFATLYIEHDASGDLCTDVHRYQSTLMIKNIISHKRTFFTLHNHFDDPFGFNSPTLAFNKQGTLLIVHYYNDNKPQDKNDNTRQSKREYKIFKDKRASYRDAPENPLSKYFAYRMVCKDVTKQITPY